MKADRTPSFSLVLGLLIIVVLLPNLCLLWFMRAAVKNEHLVLRQHWTTYYTQLLDGLREPQETHWHTTEELLEGLAPTPPEKLAYWIEQRSSIEDTLFLGSLLVYNEQDQLVYPRVNQPLDSSQEDPRLNMAQRLEYVDGNKAQALSAYQATAQHTEDQEVLFEALMGQTRCLRHLGHIDEALSLCRQMAYPGENGALPITVTHRVHARLLLLSLYRQTDLIVYQQEIEKQLEGMLENLSELPTALKALVWRELIAQAQLLQPSDSLAGLLSQAQRRLDTLELSLACADVHPDYAAFRQWPKDTLMPLPGVKDVYAVCCQAEGKTFVSLRQVKDLSRTWRRTLLSLIDNRVWYRLLDGQGQVVIASPQIQSRSHADGGNVFLHKQLPMPYSRWSVELFFPTEGLSSLARHRRQIYLGIGIIIMAMTVILAMIIAQCMSRQVKLNQLKNDFLATVTHELKTPLASTRLLVDTILAGNCQDTQEEREFLKLIAKENERLSRLIDNFLCFSRMERRKRSFEPKPTRPVDLVQTAVETVSASYQDQDCRLSVSCADTLPRVRVDPDAWVRALVNLLDNACKYSHKPREVRLEAYEKDQNVCFAVIDRGMGMNARQVKRVFDKFYQADPSLTRQQTGCGLGLSIVKFIVESHHGRVHVKSQPGQGTTFIIECSAL